VWEQGGSSGKVPVVDLSSSSDEGDLITDVSRDEEFVRRLFGDLNYDVLGPPGDGKIIILSDSDEEEDARSRPLTVKLHHLLLQGLWPQLPPPTTPMAPTRVKLLIGRQMVAAAAETKSARLRLPR
jgi:hypothetical protein